MASPLDLTKLHAAAITAGLDRDALLSGIDKRFVASLPRASSRGAQLLQDLHELAAVDRLTDGTIPLRAWLLNAVRLSEMRTEEEAFQAALRTLESTSPGAGAPLPRSVPPPVPGPVAAETHLRLYISASTADRQFVERLRKHLSPVASKTGMEVWDRSQIQAGQNVNVAERKLAEANIVVLILSADFLASNDTYSEATRARARLGPGTRLVPILARPCLWSSAAALEGLTISPRNGKAISTHSDIDSAFSSVVEDIGAVAEDLLRPTSEARSGFVGPTTTKVDGPRTAVPTTSASDPRQGPRPPEEAGGSSHHAQAGASLTAVFERSGTPTLLYVEPAQARRIRASLRTLGRGLVIEGPSKIGKTTALRRALGDAPCKWLDAYSDVDRIRAMIDARELAGQTVIDNAHALPAEVLEKLARWLRVEADERAPRGKLTLACIPGTTRRLTATQRDLVGRLDEVRMQRQPVEKIRELVDRAEVVARLRFSHKAEIVRASLGSFQLAQMLCFECAMASDLELVPAEETVVAGSVADVRAEVQREIAGQFDDLALAFVKADAHTPTPGAGLAFLWTLSRSDSDGVALARLRSAYPTLGPAWDFWERAGHEDPSGTGVGANRPATAGRPLDLREVAQLVSGSLVSEDPLFLFYLQGLDWSQLAERAGILIEWQKSDGELVVPVAPAAAPSSERASVRKGARSLYEEPSYPWWLPDAVRLRDLLVGAYPDVAQISMLAKTAGIHLGQFTPAGGAVEPAWNSLLELASRQSKLESLMNRALSDPNAGSYREGIRSTLKMLGVTLPES